MPLERQLTRDEALEALQHIHAQLGKVTFMEQVFWDRKEANLESRRVDISNPTYKGSDVDLTFPSPGCGGGPWDSVPPGHKAQAVDLALAKPVLDKLGLPDTVEGYECLFGAAYVGSHLGRGAIWRAAQADAEVEGWRYKVALAAALRYEP